MAGKIRAQQLDLVSMKQLFATTDSIKTVNKDLVYNIDSVMAGPNKMESIFPYYAKVKKITANLPANTVLVQPVTLSVECYQNGVWVVIDSVSISAGSTSATKLILSDFTVNNERIRVNVTSCPSGVSGLSVITTLLATVA